MMVADPREVKFTFFYKHKRIEKLLQDYDFTNLDNGIIRVSIAIENIKQVNVLNKGKIIVVINSPVKGTVEGVKLNAARSINILTLISNTIHKKTIMLAEVSQYNIGDEIDESFDSEDVDMSDWKTN